MNRCAQLDQNLSTKKLIDACNQSGGVTPLPIPEPLKGKEDRLVLQATATMTWKIALKILSDFKEQFTLWQDTPWNNSIITLRPSYVEVQIVDGSELKRTAFIDRKSEGWQKSLEATLRRNAKIGQG